MKRLIFCIPIFTAFFKFSSPVPDPPCKTKGISITSFSFFSSSKSSFGVPLYVPCDVPTATAKQSIPVSSTNLIASSGFVKPESLVSVYSKPCPT
ncbi:hypothetical protein D3C76_1430350 [compost metagenome]